MLAYFTSLNPAALVRACPGGIAQGLIWGVMALGVYWTFRILDFADLSVDGSFATGGAVSIMLILNGWNPELSLLVALLSGLLAGFVTGVLHTRLGIPTIL
ncbi:MAG: ABC transporter permease, partial [Kiritimatiellae bacterium]|nr:ABC transporter permease [Kiritimatiellia bacterium]